MNVMCSGQQCFSTSLSATIFRQNLHLLSCILHGIESQEERVHHGHFSCSNIFLANGPQSTHHSSAAEQTGHFSECSKKKTQRRQKQVKQ